MYSALNRGILFRFQVPPPLSPSFNSIVDFTRHSKIFVNTLYLIRTFLLFRQNHRVENDYPIVFHGFLPLQFFGVFVAIGLYLVLMYFCGYYVSTALYLIGSLLFLKVPMKYNLMTVVVMIMMVAVVFSYFQFPFPRGFYSAKRSPTC